MESLYGIVGKSFPILDGTVRDIYMMFQSKPTPFYLIKARDSTQIYQMPVIDLLNLLQTAAPELFAEVLL